MEQNSRISSFRANNYAAAIVNLKTLKDNLNAAAVGVPYYFAINMANGGSKVFYFINERSSVDGAFIVSFYRDFTTYNSTDHYGYQEDYLIKGYASNACTDEEVANPAIEKMSGAPKTAMIDYIPIFLDATQVICSMPF